MRFNDRKIFFQWMTAIAMALHGAMALTGSPEAWADLVEEFEDLDRQQRPETQLPALAPAPKPAEKGPEKGQEKAQDKSKIRSTKRKATRAPVQFESKSLQALKDQNRVMLKEDVIVIQGDFRLEAEEATIYFDSGTREASKVVASGRVKAFKSDSELKQRMKAECNEAIFHSQDRKLILRGNAKLWHGEDLVRGKQITYELDTGWIKADRVEGVVQPGGKK